jgi:hypothetical protein
MGVYTLDKYTIDGDKPYSLGLIVEYDRADYN